jgi:hypothetical protein
VDPETSDALHRLARVMVGTALAGGGARLTLGAVQPASYPSPAPKPPPRVTVPLAAPAADEDEPAAPRPALGPAKLAGGESYLPEWATPVTSAVHTPEWFDRFYQSVLGAPPPKQTPMSDPKAWAPTALAAGGVAGGLGGWMLGDKLVRAHQRSLAERELERSKREYMDAAYGGAVKASNLLLPPPPLPTPMTAPGLPALAASATPPLAAARPAAATPPAVPAAAGLPAVKPTPAPSLKASPATSPAANLPAPKAAPAKAAALAAELLGAPTDPHLKAAKAALDAAFDGFGKRADDGVEHSLLYRWLFPLTNAGPLGAAANLGVMGLVGAGGAYGGYRYARNTDLERLRREQLEAAEREDQADRPPVVVGELRPTPSKPRPLSFAAGRLAPAG